MFITEKRLTLRRAIKNPNEDLKALARACTLFGYLPTGKNIGIIISESCKELDPIAFAGYLNSSFIENKANTLCLVLDINLVLNTIKHHSYYDAIQSLQLETSEVAKQDTNVFFIIADPIIDEEYTKEWNMLSTYLSTKTDIKSLILTHNAEYEEELMQVHKKVDPQDIRRI